MTDYKISAEAIWAAKKQLEARRPLYPERFHGVWFTPHGKVVVDGTEGLSGSPEAIAWIEEELERWESTDN